MSFVVTLVAFAPPARADGVPFNRARIEEAAVVGGPFSVIDTQTLTPLDTDPLHPNARELTTSKATLESGWYRVVWLDAANHESAPTAAIENIIESATGPRPTLAEVAAKVRARTKILGGKEVGTFDARTRPTGDEVEALIDDALDDVLGKVQPPAANSAYERRVRGAVALYAAVLIEMSYFPEQVGAGKSPASTYEKLYEGRIRALIAEGETGEPQGEGDHDAPADPAWIFPTTTLGRW